MAVPQSVYTDKITHYQTALKKTKKQLLVSSMLRLAVFLALVFVVYLLWENTSVIIAIIIGGIIGFIYLVAKHQNLKEKRHKIEALIALNKTEIEVLKGEFDRLPTGKIYKNETHEYSRDIDLFGDHSFFQYLNRTALKEGGQQLATMLTANNIKHITHRQEATKDLSEKIDFRQEFSASAQLATTQNKKETLTVQRRLQLLKKHKPFTPNQAKLLSSGFSIISLGLITAYFLGFISGWWAVGWLFVGLGVTGIYAKRVNQLSAKVDNVQAIFQQYHKLLALLEETTFSSTLMQGYQNRIIKNHDQKASIIIREFAKTIDALDQRNNLIFGFLGNGFLLWDLRQSSKLEKWISTYTAKAEDWFEVIAIFDAFNSLGNFAFNHPHYTFPEITQNSTVIKAKAAVHPLIPTKAAVTNDYTIDKDEFFIITGANMAGKSTFLRTVALQIVMSNTGLPVCAAACAYSPIKLITSMCTADSLAEEASYFYAELSRLKFIIDQLQQDNYFIVLDEILKGTNSTDKAIGSRKFLEKLAASHSTGIIATHDLSLCKVAEQLPQVKNHYFDAQIIDDELYFDYTFKPGICQNMNASFLLRKMQIVDE